MLEIKSISKTYKTGDLVQVALNKVSLNLRDNEFVAILGPSGSGKTTLLNIIGGLDRYDDGDLIINGTSTKKYKDRDWDTYRNHTIGFVFQSYNLIPHQTILSNVELALTIGGVSKKERKQRALQALDEVGLKDQAHKKPNQMSGGQMQRVAIARALINNPDILLADEPTGALDTKTSIQVMDLLRKVAKDRLVVMVTHNPDLANEYANRIVQLKDGEIISDTNPYNPSVVKINKTNVKTGKAKMNFLTALSLSFNNLLTKKGRTILTAFAGSIGIIGIALILSLSQGFQNYIDKIQEDTLSSYPLTITSDTADMTTAILSMVSDRRENKVEGENVIERQYLTTMFSSIGSNDLKSFKKYLEDNEKDYSNDVTQIKYSYSVTPNIFSIDAANSLVKLYPSSMWNMLYSNSASSFMSSFSSASGGMIFAEIPEDLESVKDQYDVLKGRWPEKYDEMIIVLSEPNSISDLLVYSLGLRDTAELKTIISSLMSQDEVEITHNPKTFSYDDLMNLDFRLVKPSDTFKYNSKYDVFEDMSSDDDYMRSVYDKSLKLKIVGIVCPSDPDSTSALSPGVNFRSDLTQYVIDQAKQSEIVKKQLSNKDVDVFSGKNFDQANKDSKNDSELNFEDMISIDEDLIKEAFKINVDFENNFDKNTMTNIAVSSAQAATVKLVHDYTQTQTAITTIVGGLNMPAPMPSYTGIYTNMTICFARDYDDPANPGTPLYNDDNVNDFLNKYWNSSDYDTAVTPFISFISRMGMDLDKDAITTLIKGTCEFMFKKFANDPSTPVNITDTDVVAEINNNAKSIMDLQNMGTIAEAIGKAIAKTMEPLQNAFGEDMMSIDTDKFASAFKFDMSEDELSRLMETMLSGTDEKSYKSNLISLGYQDVNDPTSISFYFKDFESKENFLTFIDNYNNCVDDEEKELSYTDITGILMSSVKTIVDSVTYVLIAFVSISLIVSSIMIAVITLISVMERTKEIGILRAMGASKHNVSSIFNAETFIIGLLSGTIGIGFTFAVIPPINVLIHNLTDNYDINAVLPYKYAVILVIIAVVLTILAGIIPSRKASKQDPVIALRTE